MNIILFLSKKKCYEPLEMLIYLVDQGVGKISTFVWKIMYVCKAASVQSHATKKSVLSHLHKY